MGTAISARKPSADGHSAWISRNPHLACRAVSYEVAFFSVVPSPYQSDLFRALASRPEVNLRVFYLGPSIPESPWPEKPLAEYESVLPGGWLPVGQARCQWNWPLPDLRNCDLVGLNTLMSFTAQWLMRVSLRKKPWVFWGERLSRGGAIHTEIAAPLHRASGIVSIGAFAETDYRERFPEPRHFRIPYHCDLDAFLALPRRDRSDGNVVFFFCGQMIARKGIDLLLTAFQRLAKNARLLLVGREAELPELLKALPEEARGRVLYEGFQSPEALPAFFARADVFVLPSRYDGWGVVVNQALGAGLPVICSDRVGAGYDIVAEDDNGLKFPAGDADALARCMERFMNEPQCIERFGDSSHKKAREILPEVGAEKWVNAIRTIVPR
jgi:glycosyltransferase involved in cell wall biosynthesis